MKTILSFRRGLEFTADTIGRRNQAREWSGFSGVRGQLYL